MKKQPVISAIEKQNKIIENMMNPYQSIMQNTVHTFTQTIDIAQNLPTLIIDNLNISAVSQIPASILQSGIDVSAGIKAMSLNLDATQTMMAPIMEQIRAMQIQQSSLMNKSFQLEGIKSLLEAMAPTLEWKEMYEGISFEDIQELIDEEYLSDDFQLNQARVNLLSEKNKEIVSKKFHSVYKLIVLLQIVLGFLDSNTLKYLTKNVPIINHAYQTIHNVNSSISTDGHITKDTELYSYSSNNSAICGHVQYGIPFEVIEYHSGWLKIKYNDTSENIQEGWIQEDNAVWSFIKE